MRQFLVIQKAIAENQQWLKWGIGTGAIGASFL
jgi:hypothetical protein